ncbi:MAG: four helix bundle protein [Bacteroidota bacterium]
MGKVESYQELEVWKQTKDLVKHIYELTKSFPKEEQFGLTNQLRRAAVSIPSNIAEGCGRNHFKDSIQLFFIARGSLYEVETQLVIAFDLKYVSPTALEAYMVLIKSCKRLLNGFINYFQKQADNSKSSTINEAIVEYKTNIEPITN